MRRRDFFLDPIGDGNSFLPYIIGIPAFIVTTVVFQDLFLQGMLAVPDYVPAHVKAAFANNDENAPRLFYRWLATSWSASLIFATLSLTMMGLAALLTVRIIHLRPMTTVLAVGGRFLWSRVALGVAAFSAIVVPIYAINIIQNPEAFTFSFEPKVFALLVALAVPLFLVQSASEEIVFRGYVGQLVGALTGSKILIVLTSSVLFALAHYPNPEVGGLWWRLLPYFYSGFFLMLISIRDQGIELAIGGHFANNLWISLLFSQQGTALDTPALFKLEPLRPGSGGEAEIWALIISSAFVPAMFWAVTAVLPRRK
jgi:membrane protease YdiL (CAAX protease family)